MPGRILPGGHVTLDLGRVLSLGIRVEGKNTGLVIQVLSDETEALVLWSNSTLLEWHAIGELILKENKMQRGTDIIREYVELFIEKKVREADVSDGSRVPHGSSKHIRDLTGRIAGLETFRNKQKRGSEARATYSRLIQRLKGELASAKRADAKAKLQKHKIRKRT